MLEHQREADLKDLFFKRAFCLKLPTWQTSVSSGQCYSLWVPCVQRVRREGGEGGVRSCFLMSLPMLLNCVPGTILMC